MLASTPVSNRDFRHDTGVAGTDRDSIVVTICSFRMDGMVHSKDGHRCGFRHEGPVVRGNSG